MRTSPATRHLLALGGAASAVAAAAAFVHRSRRASYLEVAHALSREVGGIVDLDAVYRRAVAHLAGRMRSEGVAVLRPVGDALVLVAAEGPLRIEAGYAQAREAGLLGLAVRSGEPVVSNDVRSDPRCIVAPGMERLRSELVMPIRDRDGAVQAVLDVTSTRPGRFGADELALLGTVVAALEGAVTAAALYGRLAARAATDPLTGLPNHRTFQERLLAAIEGARVSGTPLALCLIDLDRFKEVNDAGGHLDGDRVLARAARALAAVVRRGETLARVGGDEFAWILPGSDAHGALAAAERGRAAIARELADVGATASVGICDLAWAAEPDALFRLADGALYWAKAQGRDLSVVYSPHVVRALSAEERAAQAERRQALKGLRALARAVDAKDPSTRDHSERVARTAAALARAMGWPDDAVARLRQAALLHDVGKIGVPDAVLRKCGPLTPEEFETIAQHAALGAQIAAEVLTAEQTAWVRGHHERPDGRGYPDGLVYADIPVGARILAVADTFDAMTSDRPYRPALSHAEAVAECRAVAGTQLCPLVVEALIALAPAPEAAPAPV